MWSGPRWARRTAGCRAGTPSIWPPSPCRALIERNDLDPALIEDVVYGCTMTVGEQAMNIGRNAALAAGFPDTVPGTTVDRQCGSAQQAVHFAAQAVMAGAMDVVIGGGVEAMSRVPIGSTTDHGPGDAYGPVVHERFDFIHQGLSAEEIAPRWGIDREEMDRFSLRSHERAARAIAEGRFDERDRAVGHPTGPGGGQDRPGRDRRRGSRRRGPARPSTKGCGPARPTRSWPRSLPASSRTD